MKEPLSLPEEKLVWRSLPRLLLGGLFWGADALLGNPRNPESPAPEETPPETPVHEQNPMEFDPLPETLPPPISRATPTGGNADLPYALIGLLFESEEKLENWLSLAKRVRHRAKQTLTPWIGQLEKKLIFTPKHPTRLDQWAARGQSEVDRWVARGFEEEKRSRQLVQQTVQTTVDQSIRYLAQNPELENLIHEQSTGLAEQILAESRQRAVSADDFLEGFLRYLFRRPPRTFLPSPSPEVQAQAAWKFRDEPVGEPYGK